VTARERTATPRLVTAHVKPGSRTPEVRYDGELLVIAVREAAREGRANEAARRALAEHLGIGISRVRLVRGATARVKTFCIES